MASVSVPTNSRRRDWFKILRDLMRAGVSMSEVGRKCHRDIKTVAHWGDGGDPKDSDARTVLALYARHCPDQYAEHQAQFEIRRVVAELPEVTKRRKPAGPSGARPMRVAEAPGIEEMQSRQLSIDYQMEA